MREIKFRGWDRVNKKMFYQGSTVDENREIFWKRWEITPGPADPMQYTELRDRSGQEIYEGDIVKREGHVYSVEYGKGCFFLRVNGNREPTTMELIENFIKSRFLGHFHNQCQVVGNIYQNPELLKP